MKVFACGTKKPFKHDKFEEMSFVNNDLSIKLLSCGYNHILLVTQDDILWAAGM
jgi:alpha-tubulin suppressor-like RCC1 family protein